MKRLLTGLLIFGTLFVLVAFAVWNIKLVRIQDGSVEIADFAYHVLLVKAFWFEAAHDIYRFETQERILSQFTGGGVGAAMPIGVTPVAFVLWLPFAAVALHSLWVAYVLWITLSLTCLLYCLVPLLRSSRTNRLVCSVFIVGLSSLVFLRALILGQTSIIYASALLAWICRPGLSPSGKGFIVLLSALKPPYLLITIALALYDRELRTFFRGALLIAVCGTGPMLLLGTSGIGDYLSALGTYAHGTEIAGYAQSIRHETMTIFVNAFAPFLEKALLFQTSLAFFWILTLAGLGAAACSHFTGFYLTVAAYLLFSPYAGAYEDFLLLVLAAPLVRLPQIPRLTPLTVFLPLSMTLSMNSLLFSTSLGALSLWVIKASTIAFAAYLAVPGFSMSQEREHG